MAQQPIVLNKKIKGFESYWYLQSRISSDTLLEVRVFKNIDNGDIVFKTIMIQNQKEYEVLHNELYNANLKKYLELNHNNTEMDFNNTHINGDLLQNKNEVFSCFQEMIMRYWAVYFIVEFA